MKRTAPILNPVRIVFTPCTGYGSNAGLSASLYDVAGDCTAYGNGADEFDAVIDALTEAGVPFDTAFDYVGSVIDSARIERE